MAPKPTGYQPSAYSKPNIGGIRDIKRSNLTSLNKHTVAESHSLNRLPTPSMGLSEYGGTGLGAAPPDSMGLNFNGGIPMMDGVMSRRPG